MHFHFKVTLNFTSANILLRNERIKTNYSDQPVCTDDCTGLKFTQNGEEFIVHCKTQTGINSFCNKITNQCDKDATQCITKQPDCALGDGLYPNLIDCTR